ncbi:biliverdin-producing heme oxygenase [Gluconobacter cerinus]|uniref:biliverdin-producing heme oxygenase n=1 Tax=Gluconobacter TaxID=441 RepID=UPI000A38D913|nr:MULTISPECIES: biliverdin-producing heme oxygenase [Gluconobacter]MBS1024101.1 biliverdin-producing heme oxygenase [Gluconobacter cerinus]MBS1029813.1 biliverdin-producing heme oxygenase [Gluconobacter cerinus]MBS1038382.1 biliverdin-producing heme oxygenase [Gluconobacter cerinus]MBS1039270.1 biliverdin-producing heme oxygenase [Gluconobacter cerinus]MBS1043352.1 biliverdin-producing heme oxygenase [Gluconobacter cerinus]
MSAFFTDNTLSLALREKTKSIHDRTDHKIMSMGIFSSLDGYRIFLLSQYVFLRDMTNIYENEMLRNLLPDLETRNRFPWVEADMRDLGLAAPMAHRGNVIPFNPSVAVGWLYVAEGSKLGANILSKMAMSLGLTESFGARHLAPAPEGRGLSWKTFKAAIDSADLDRAICVSAAEEAFARFSSCLDQMAALNSEEIFSASQNERVSL